MAQIDAFPAPKRGRPATGTALSAAERKRQQRERDSHAIWSPEGNISDASTRGITDAIASCVERGNVDSVEWLTRELIRRAKERDGHAIGSRPEPTHPGA